MAFRITCYLVVFWSMQVIAQLFFKWGSGAESRWVWGFVAGNLFGFSSIWLLMLLYKAIHPNIALGIAAGGGFLFNQIALAIVFKSRLGLVQSAGIAAIVAGMIALAAGRSRPSRNDALPDVEQVSSEPARSAEQAEPST